MCYGNNYRVKIKSRCHIATPSLNLLLINGIPTLFSHRFRSKLGHRQYHNRSNPEHGGYVWTPFGGFCLSCTIPSEFVNLSRLVARLGGQIPLKSSFKGRSRHVQSENSEGISADYSIKASQYVYSIKVNLERIQMLNPIGGKSRAMTDGYPEPCSTLPKASSIVPRMTSPDLMIFAIA